MWPISIDARWQIEAAQDEHTEMRYPIRASEFANRRLQRPCLLRCATVIRATPPHPGADRTIAPRIIDNEHQTCLPNWPQYCRATPTEWLPFLGKPVSSMIHAWIGSSRVMDGRTHSRTRRSIA